MRKDTSRNKQQIRSKKERETREGFEFYIGIDLGDKNSDVCVLDQSGEVSKEFRLRMKEADFRTYFASIPRSRVAIEAGGLSCRNRHDGIGKQPGDHRRHVAGLIFQGSTYHATKVRSLSADSGR
jgi:hypothetical protein